MEATQIGLVVLLGLGLAASTGLNATLPLLLLAGAARFNIVPLNDGFKWLSSDVAIFVLIVAAILEIVGDKIPSVDHFLDVAGTIVRPVAGGMAFASVLTDADPATAAIVGLIIGSPISFGFHTVKTGTRVASSAMTFGCANPVLSIIEDVIAVLLSVAAIFAPILVPLLLVLLVLLGWKMLQRVRASVPADRSAP
jgi:uncharacterized membrane protein